ncbi:MAG: serine/threonine protein kinase [Myxococcales bacterium]|nr:serine/threonine protein kinase [Myxococcales bacterium]
MTERGRIIAGRFTLAEPIATGSAATVYRAIDRDTGARVALKLAVVDGAALARFERETRALASVQCERLPALVAYGPTGDRDREVFVALALVEGVALRSLLDEPMDEPRVRALGMALCEALEALHKHGIVHRDVKPENIVVPDANAVDAAVLVDLGLALASGDTRAITAGGLVGTLGYLPPEQLSETPGPVTPRWDVFSLGCVLYECATGVAPFGGRDPRDALARTVAGPAPDPKSIVPTMRDDFAELLRAMTAPRVADRPEDAAAVRARLASLAPVVTRAGHEPPEKFIAVILGHPTTRSSPSSSTPLVSAFDPDGTAELDPSLVPRGARVRSLADGTLLLWFASPRLDRSFAVRAVQCALLLADARRELCWSVAISEGSSRNGWPVGRAFDRSIAMADECVPDHVAIDDVLSLLVDGAFTLRSAGKSQLIAR